MTTVPGTSISYNYTSNGLYFINGSTEIVNGIIVNNGRGSNTNPPTGTGWIYYNTVGNAATGVATGTDTSVPTFTTYVNVPSDITYYLFNTCLFATTSTAINSYNQCAFSNVINWNATRLSAPKSNIPYSSYFGPTTIPPTTSGGSGSTSGSTSGSASGSASGGKSTFLRNMHRPMY
jgi:hypothetical protein